MSDTVNDTLALAVHLLGRLHVLNQFESHKGQCSSPMARRSSLRKSILVHEDRQIEVDENKAVLSIAVLVHYVAFADVAMQNQPLVP
ncbi:hypothetical protein BC835DRAFT_1402466 [Cytidiella melzeri]|nr:hypothetical protein BC835DRAFT_1402466 [Cytidiella melzeri]